MDFEISGGKIKLKVDGKTVSWLNYEAEKGRIHLIDTHTAEGFGGKGYAGQLVEFALKYAERFDEILISCPYIKRWTEKRGYRSERIRFTDLLRFKEEIEVFNHYHEPEAVARYAGYEDGLVKVRFSGYMCMTCGVYDYFEDLIQEVDAEIVDYEEDDEGFLVTYRLKRL
ncbi:MAG: N-acetyltransferase [Archaeoglobi archaeon]|nr:N-acetyltransferase [Archaeoglobi archaeon]